MPMHPPHNSKQRRWAKNEAMYMEKKPHVEGRVQVHRSNANSQVP